MNNGRLSNGFILGLIIGGGAVFLFGTKTGKKLLKKFSEEGLGGLTEILSEVDLENYDDEEDFGGKETELSVGSNHAGEDLKEEVREEVVSPSKKRFFRKSSK